MPADACPAVVTVLEAACTAEAREHGPGWVPHPTVVELLRALRLAPIVAQLAEATDVSGTGSAVADVDEDEYVTGPAAADLLGLSPRRVCQLASTGRWPGARRVAGRWQIPRSEVTMHD